MSRPLNSTKGWMPSWNASPGILWRTSDASTASWPSCSTASLPLDDAAYQTDRVLIGLRRWTWTPLPSLSPAVSQRFSGRLDFARAALASANAPPIASLRPAIRYAGAWCADGVNAFSLWCAVPYMCAVMQGAAVAAPASLTVNGAAALPWNQVYEPCLESGRSTMSCP